MMDVGAKKMCGAPVDMYQVYTPFVLLHTSSAEWWVSLQRMYHTFGLTLQVTRVQLKKSDPRTSVLGLSEARNPQNHPLNPTVIKLFTGNREGSEGTVEHAGARACQSLISPESDDPTTGTSGSGAGAL